MVSEIKVSKGSQSMIQRRSWENFRENGLLWWVNRGLHLFGWAIVLEMDECGGVTDCYPARVPCRGFDPDTETDGFRALTEHLTRNSADLLSETRAD